MRTPRTKRSRTRESGFSLLELVVAVAIFTIVMGAVYQLLLLGSSDRFTTHQRVEAIQSARVAMNSIGRDALNAGVGFPPNGATIPDGMLTLVGLPADGDGAPDLLTPVIAGDNLNPNDLNPAGVQTDMVVFVYGDDAFNSGEALSIDSITPSGSQLRMDTSGPDGISGNSDDVDNTICTIGDLYLVTGGVGSAIGQLTGFASSDKLIFADSDPLDINQPSAATGNIARLAPGPASLAKINWVRYFVTRDGILMRRVYGSAAGMAGEGLPDGGETRWLDEPLAMGVEDMQLEYVLSTGVVTTNPAAEEERKSIRQLRVNLLVRSPEIDQRTNEPFRVRLSCSFSARNLAYQGR